MTAAHDPIVIVAFARTPMGGFQGALSGVKATDLGAASVKAAVERVQGDLSNKEKVKEALLAKEVETVFGPMPFDPRNNQAILDIYVNEIKEGAGGPVNQVIHTYKAVRDPGPVA